ncbi:MAG: hypothetical protein QM747_10635 [Nocardioides sp.]
MSDSDSPEVPEGTDVSPEPDEAEWRRRRRLAEVFGDVLPETTSDERDAGDSTSAEQSQDRWLRSQVPPHHG